jgi:hypothetical protein
MQVCFIHLLLISIQQKLRSATLFPFLIRHSTFLLLTPTTEMLTVGAEKPPLRLIFWV